MSKIHFIGSLTFAKDSKNAKIFSSMQNCNKKLGFLVENCSFTVELQKILKIEVFATSLH